MYTFLGCRDFLDIAIGPVIIPIGGKNNATIFATIRPTMSCLSLHTIMPIMESTKLIIPNITKKTAMPITVPLIMDKDAGIGGIGGIASTFESPVAVSTFPVSTSSVLMVPVVVRDIGKSI
jgi:hypothetical protein